LRISWRRRDQWRDLVACSRWKGSRCGPDCVGPCGVMGKRASGDLVSFGRRFPWQAAQALLLYQPRLLLTYRTQRSIPVMTELDPVIFIEWLPICIVRNWLRVADGRVKPGQDGGRWYYLSVPWRIDRTHLSLVLFGSFAGSVILPKCSCSSLYLSCASFRYFQMNCPPLS
jgi:hypothetical protein